MSGMRRVRLSAAMCLAFCSAALMSACSNAPSSRREAPFSSGERCVDRLVDGVDLPPGTTVVACGLAPGSELIDVVDGVVLTSSPRGTFFRGELGVAERTLLHRGPADDHTATYADGQVVFDGWLPLPDGRGARAGMLAIPVDALDTGSARMLSEARDYVVGGRVLSDGLVRYVSQAGSATVLELDVATGVTRRVVNGTAVGLSASWLYYCSVESEVRRIRRGGTEDQLLAARTVPAPHCTAELRAVDEEGIYLTRQDAPYEIWRFGPDGREDYIATAPEGPGGDFIVPPPARLFLHGSFLYTLQAPSGTSSGDALARVSLSGGEHTFLVSGTDLGPPLFRDGAVYVSMTRDGLDGPVDGVVLRIEQSSL